MNIIHKKQHIIRLALAFGLLGFGQFVFAQEVKKSAPAGTGIYEAVINQADGHIFVSSAGSRNNPGGALYKIDPTTLAIVDSIPMKENPPFGLGINNKTQVVYTTNTRSNSVSAVDLKSKKVLATFNAGGEKSHTREVLVDEDNNMVYVTNVGDPSDIWVIDGKTNKVVRTIDNVGKTTTALAFNKKKDKLFATVMGTNEIAIIDIKSGQVEKSFASGGESPVNLVADGERLFVANQKSGTVTVLNAKTGELLKSIPTGAGAIGITYDKKSNRIYSANRQTGTTTVIDAKSYEVLADLTTGSHPNHVRVNPKTGVAYVINKTKGARPVEGQPAPAPDTNGDTISKIK